VTMREESRSGRAEVVGAIEFDGLYAREFDRTARLAGLLGASDPEDVANEAFTRLLSRVGRFDAADAAVAYLRVIVLNIVRREGSRATTLRHLLARIVGPGAEAVPADAEPIRGDVAAAIRRLPIRQREAIVLRYWLDLSVVDTAATMNVPLGTAKSHLSRAMATLRASITSTENGEARA